MTLPALLAPATLDGTHLSAVPADEWRITNRRIVAVTELATGDLRDSYTYAGPGERLIKTKIDVTLEWKHLGALAEFVGERMAIPGPHTLVLWRREPLVFVGNGTRFEFTLPWLHALDFGSPDGNLNPSHFEPKVKVGEAGTVLTYEAKSQVDYDAGDPAVDEVWFLENGRTFKLAEPPMEGEYVFAHVVPLLSVVEAAEPAEKRFDRPAYEPRILRLREI